MLKNVIISSLLMYIWAQEDGWLVSGTSKFIACAILSLMIAYLIKCLEDLVKLLMED